MSRSRANCRAGVGLAGTESRLRVWIGIKLASAAATALLLILLPQAALAGGPRYVSGASFFDSATPGTPILWASGAIGYYTDQGDLSPALPEATANAFVADAFTRWSSIATAAVSATRAGQLDENVSGSNLFPNGDGTITMPPDLVPATTTKAIAVVYDADGAVTDALLGSGAGSTSNCFVPADGNAVFGGPDSFSPDAHLAHALVVINGNCVPAGASASQIQDVKYRLVRILGRVLGLDWSQANLDPPAQDDAGFPVMHAFDPVSCVPISSCYVNADQPKMDDRAALSRLYPVTQANLAAFPGKTLFQPSTVRIHGSVYFVDANGQPAQPMQGVNVVARLIDGANPLNSRTYVASSVSGFLFRGNAGNAVSGFTDPATALRYDRFGSNDPALEGFYDLDGLEVPDPTGIAEYQISVEPLSAVESQMVGPYAPSQVRPSGSAPSALVTITLGNDIQQDLVMTGSTIALPDSFGPQNFGAPAAVPGAGDWTGSLSGYGDVDYFQFSGLANRTLTVETTALDGAGQPTTTKAMPVVGLWALSETEGPPDLATPEVFNGPLAATTRLDASVNTSTSYRLGIADYRGDGRPDYRYHARIFYGGQVTPPRAGTGGGTPLLIQGLGFRGNTQVLVGGVSSPLLGIGAGTLLVSAPQLADGVQDVTLADPVTGASSVMSGAL
ncbi:MAG TPA: IPT/TIG domain-containing protein, partial [Verrucomicrobiae bacterium]|nr:IPT/TIG domain-containing protein [Verrucomicrobiae bacterium]